MSVKIISNVWDNSKAEGAALLVLLALADHANDDGICWPSVARIAELARIDQRQVQRVITQLIDAGELHALRRGGRGHSSLYLVTLGHTDRSLVKVLTQRFELSEADARQTSYAILGKRDGQRVTSASPISPERVTSERERVTSGAERVTSEAERVTKTALKGDIAMSPEPSLTALTEPSENRQENRAETEPDSDTVEVWNSACQLIRLELPAAAYDRLRDVECVRVPGAAGAPAAYELRCPDREQVDFLRLRLNGKVAAALTIAARGPVTVAYVARSAPGSAR